MSRRRRASELQVDSAKKKMSRRRRASALQVDSAIKKMKSQSVKFVKEITLAAVLSVRPHIRGLQETR